MSQLASRFVEAVRGVVGDDPVVPLHVPEVGPDERRLVDECLVSTFVSSVGPFVTRFEEEIAQFTGSARAVAVSNGTSALQVALVVAGVRPGDDVVVPGLSFVATANAVVHAGAQRGWSFDRAAMTSVAGFFGSIFLAVSRNAWRSFSNWASPFANSSASGSSTISSYFSLARKVASPIA